MRRGVLAGEALRNAQRIVTFANHSVCKSLLRLPCRVPLRVLRACVLLTVGRFDIESSLQLAVNGKVFAREVAWPLVLAAAEECRSSSKAQRVDCQLRGLMMLDRSLG